MVTNIFNIDLNVDGNSGTYISETRVLNELEFELNLNYIKSNNVDLIKTKIIFGTQIFTDEFEDIKNNFSLRKKDSFYDIKKDILQIRLYYSNFNIFEYLIPLVFIPPNTLDYFDGATIQNAQFIDTKENDDLFFVMKNSKNQLFNFRSGSNVTAYKNYMASLSTEEDQIINILSGTLSTVPTTTANIVTRFGEYIEVTT
jgi:hypothetical protein